MKNLIFCCFASLLFACQNKATQNADTLPTQKIENHTDKVKLYIKDKSKYSATFLEGISKANYPDPIQIIDDYMIIGADTTRFPSELALGKPTLFKANKRNETYLLVLTRINETTVQYQFEWAGKNKKIIHSTGGEANLSPMFFLANETDDDDADGESYGSSEYASSKDSCWLSIRVGIGNDKKGKQRAKISFACEGNALAKSLTLGNCPTLRTE